MRKKWTARNRASIATWDLSVRFYRKEQAAGVIMDLLTQDITYDFSFEHTMGDGTEPPAFIITIPGVAWANNLQDIADILHAWDYDMEGPSSD